MISISPQTSPKIVLPEQNYCSQERTPLPPIKTIEEGVKIIERILAKGVLCRHDVENINQAYQAIDLLEGRVDQIPKLNSLYALNKIIEKVQIASGKAISSSDLISLYHLQDFSDKDLSIADFFKRSSAKLEKQYSEELASILPCCTSIDQFDKDVEALVGSKKSEKVEKILAQKKEKLQSYEATKQAIASKKLELDRQNYPDYLHELLNVGNLHLYEHIVEMKKLPKRGDRTTKIEQMMFSDLSHVILETRGAVIQKVESFIPVGHKNTVFLVGGTRAGKSTTLCYLRGDKMKLQGPCYVSKSDQAKLIGQSETTSCTFLPTVEIVNFLNDGEFIFVDFPGFDDTNSNLIALGMEFALKALIKKYLPKILVLEDITNIKDGYKAAEQLSVRLNRMVEVDTKKSFAFRTHQILFKF